MVADTVALLPPKVGLTPMFWKLIGAEKCTVLGLVPATICVELTVIYQFRMARAQQTTDISNSQATLEETTNAKVG